MNKLVLKLQLIYILTCSLLIPSCKKEDDFLNAKPQDRFATISTLNDCEYLLQTEGIFNYSPWLGKASTDDYYVETSNLSYLPPLYQNVYIWAPRIYDAGVDNSNWSDTYSQVYYANTILDALKSIKITKGEENRANQIKASALFYRSYAFNSLMQLFSTPYDSTMASTQPGIPLKVASDINIIYPRASQKECYNQIISDVLSNIEYLPPKAKYITLPSKNAAFGFLARVALIMGNYKDARSYANSALSIDNTLFDFNLAQPGPEFYYFMSLDQYPISEDIYHTIFQGEILSTSIPRTIVDSTLYNSYDDNDLRKSLYYIDFMGQKRFTGSYEFKLVLNQYEGIANDELYLIRAECAARMGDLTSAMTDLNTLLVKRYKKGTYVDKIATDPEQALQIILLERRKEMPFRGTRWTDLRRLNKDARFAVTLKRIVNGTTYILEPNDPRYTMLIPDNEIELSGLEQNKR